MAVVFPAPLAPRKPNISPRFTSKEILIDSGKVSELFHELFHPDNGFARLVSCISFQSRRAKDVFELFQNHFRDINTFDRAVLNEKRSGRIVWPRP